MADGKRITKVLSGFPPQPGALPYQGDKGRASIETAITAAKWLTEAESPKGLGDSLRNLAPSAIRGTKDELLSSTRFKLPSG